MASGTGSTSSPMPPSVSCAVYHPSPPRYASYTLVLDQCANVHLQLGEFYFVRYVLAFVCALCQTIMYRVIALTIHPRIGVLFVLATVLSPGNFHASTAYLPSSFAMYTGMLGAAAFMNWRGGLETASGIAWFALGGIVGWPFAMALCAPFLLEEALLAITSLGHTEHFWGAVKRVLGGGLLALGVLVGFSSRAFWAWALC